MDEVVVVAEVNINVQREIPLHENGDGLDDLLVVEDEGNMPFETCLMILNG